MQLFSVGYSKKGLGGCAQPPRPFLQRSVSGLLSARRPGHIPAGQYMEMQMLYTLPRLLLPMGLAPLGTHIFILGRSRSALRVSPPHRGGETAAQRRRPIFDGAPGSRLLSARRPSHIPTGQASKEMRSCWEAVFYGENWEDPDSGDNKRVLGNEKFLEIPGKCGTMVLYDKQRRSPNVRLSVL